MDQERNVNEGLSRGRGMTQHSQTSSEANCSRGGLGRGKRPAEHEDTSEGQTRPFKRPRMVGVGIYQAKDGFTTLNVSLQLSMQVYNCHCKPNCLIFECVFIWLSSLDCQVEESSILVQKLQRGLMLSLVILATHQYVDSNGRGRQLLQVAIWKEWGLKRLSKLGL